jgi:transposase
VVKRWGCLGDPGRVALLKLEVIPMKKRAYQKTPINDFSPEALAGGLTAERVVLAIDVAKREMVAALATERGEVMRTVAWTHPAETPDLLRKIGVLERAGLQIEAVMEPTGTYGDVLRRQLRDAGIPVYLASGKRVFDSKVVHDGVASLHDAKSAAIIAKLHVDGLTSLWTERTEDERGLKAAVATMDLYQVHYLRLVHQLESCLARHWPEICDVVALTSATLLAVLARIGGPADIAASGEAARRLMTGMSHRLMRAEKIERILLSAGSTVGLPLLARERAALMTLADEAHRATRLYKSAKHELEILAADGPSREMASVVGITTAAVLLTEVGDPRCFPCARSYVKAFGLNLKEKSSGKYQGRLRITKVGSGRARKYLWLAVWRWRKKDPVVQAWYEAKVERDGGSKARAVVALMRKLVRALYHVARGEEFDSRKLFDVARLRLGTRACPQPHGDEHQPRRFTT